MVAKALLVVLSFAACASDDRSEGLRRRMVEEQIAQRGVRDRRVLEALRQTPRHLYVPEELRDRAYDDTPLPIGFGQTISQPYIVGLMSEVLQIQSHHKVLEIGTGSGYQAAVLARLAGRVFSIELIPELAVRATETLRAAGLRNVVVRAGDGYHGWPSEAPFDRVILTAAPPELPDALVRQLKPGGRLVAPVGRGDDQLLFLVTKSLDGKVRRETITAVRFVPMVPGKGRD
ncbi:MAG: protein-L-isoaspartate(D-aspartate) O-methyltransferase [Bryobacteraceae bacterium]|nr:protein-L-isoaspartate(D-aspartate) O-methyltransferase [Bryobacteraceae bacterium]